MGRLAYKMRDKRLKYENLTKGSRALEEATNGTGSLSNLLRSDRVKRNRMRYKAEDNLG